MLKWTRGPFFLFPSNSILDLFFIFFLFFHFFSFFLLILPLLKYSYESNIWEIRLHPTKTVLHWPLTTALWEVLRGSLSVANDGIAMGFILGTWDSCVPSKNVFYCQTLDAYLRFDFEGTMMSMSSMQGVSYEAPFSRDFNTQITFSSVSLQCANLRPYATTLLPCPLPLPLFCIPKLWVKTTHT